MNLPEDGDWLGAGAPLPLGVADGGRAGEGSGEGAYRNPRRSSRLKTPKASSP